MIFVGRKFFTQTLGSIWLFPILLAFPLVIFSAFGINGSSIGNTYHSALYGNTKDPELLLNRPEPIRSDEWLVSTQLTIAQKEAGYPRVNPNIDSGRDMSIVGDAPYKDWSMAFRPQNLAFFIMPFLNAFAFKWWLLLFLTITSCYFFVLRLFPGKRLYASIFSTAIGCSPFLLWWYSTGTFAPIFYGFFILIVGMRIIGNEKIPSLNLTQSRILYSVVLTYLLTCFALILYPPFQIPIAIVVMAYLLGFYIEKYGLGRQLLSNQSLKTTAGFVCSVILSLVLVFTFLHSRSGVISAITNSVYPGHRTVQGGHAPVHEIFTTYLQPQLQRISRATHYYTNQSEASQFLLFLPFLILPGFVSIGAKYQKVRQVDWPLLLIQLIAVLFLLDLWVPCLQPVYKLFWLDRVPADRLFIGLGFVGVIQLLLVVRSIANLRVSPKKSALLVVLYATVCFFILLLAGLYTRAHYPQFIHSLVLIAGAAGFFSLIIFCFLANRLILGSSALLFFTCICVFRIHPLYIGLGPIYNGQLINTIRSVSKQGDSWASVDNLLYENVAMLANRDSISGVKPYPDLSYWSQVEGSQASYIYNRYAQVIFNSGLSENLKLTQNDAFQVRFACYPFIESHVRYAIATHTLNDSCTNYLTKVVYPSTTFYIYKID